MMEAEVIEYITKPQGAILQNYADCRASRSFIMGPLGSGKTIQTINKIFDLMCEQEPVTDPQHKHYNKRLSRWAAVRNTYSELTSTTIKDWLECHEEFGPYKEGSKEPPNQKLTFKLEDGTTVEAQIYFIAFDRPDHVKKARGLQLTGAWLNEIKELSKTVVDMLDLRIGRYPSKKEGATPSWFGMIGDTNAPDDDHWYYELAEESKPEDFVFHRQPGGVMLVGEKWKPNPAAENLNNLPPEYYIRGMQGKSQDWIRINLGNEYGFVADGKPVHPRYIDSVHCQDLDFTPDPNTVIVLGFDFGRTPACAFLQQAEMGRWICFDEFCAEDMSAITFGPELKRYIDTTYPDFTFGFRGYGDPSGGKGGEATDDTAHQIIIASGLPCVPTISNKAALRRAALEKPMTEMCMDGKPRFVLLPKCKKIRKGLKGAFSYRRIQVSGERYTDEPDKNEYSHPVEALEYGLQGEGEGRSAVTVMTKSAPIRKPQPIRPMGITR
jgi:hypothetical protein